MKADQLTTDQFHKMVHKIVASKPLLDRWRGGFARCHEQMSESVAKTFNQHRHHDTRPKPRIDQRALARAMGEFPARPVAGDPFKRFEGRATGTGHVYTLSTGAESRRFTNFSHFDKTEEIDGALVQRITVGSSRFHPPHSLPEDPSTRKSDVVISVYREDLGITSWASSRRFGRGETASFCYALNADQVIWISKEIPPDDRTLDDVFTISTEWWSRGEHGGERYALNAASFSVDFAQCSAQLIGDAITESYFHEHQPIAHEQLAVASSTAPNPILALSSLAATAIGAAVFIASVPLLAALALFQFSGARKASSQDGQ